MNLTVKSIVFSVSGLARQSGPHFLMFILALALLTACGPGKKYAGPYLPDAEIAVIQPGDKMFTYVNILAIDRNRLHTNESSISVHPGTHTLFLEVVLDYPFLQKYLYFNQYLTFVAEPGQVYTVNATVLPMRDEGFTWITSDRNPDLVIVKKYAKALIPLASYP